MAESDYEKSLIQHYASTWSPPLHQIRIEGGRIGELSLQFSVLVMEAGSDRMAYATCCMSQPEDEERLELHVLTAQTTSAMDNIVELLHAAAIYHRTGARLGLGHTVNFVQPWFCGSLCSYGFVSLPYPYGPSLEWQDEPEVRFLWLIPITPEEAAFKNSHGIEALEERFEAVQFNYLDPMRPSVM